MLTVAFTSGKGGTGKTTITVACAKQLASEGHSVALMDADSTGANAHKLLPISEPYQTFDVRGEPPRITPAVAEFPGARPIQFVGLALVSEAYVKWTGESHGDFVSQIYDRTNWGDAEFLLIDCPPGTHGDAMEAMRRSNVVVLVTIPSQLAKLDASRTLDLAASMPRPVAGQFINFEGVKCPYCKQEFTVFPDIEPLPIPVIQRIPIWPKMESLPWIDTAAFLNAVNHPLTLQPSEPSKLKRKMVELFVRALGKSWKPEVGA